VLGLRLPGTSDLASAKFLFLAPYLFDQSRIVLVDHVLPVGELMHDEKDGTESGLFELLPVGVVPGVCRQPRSTSA
jgi:hypothetical protein